MQKLLDSYSDDTVSKIVRLNFHKKLSLSRVQEPGYDRLVSLTKSGESYTIVSVNPKIVGDTETKDWVVSYTVTPIKKKKGTGIDPDELVVVIETKEPTNRLKKEDKVKKTQKQTKKKATKKSSNPAAGKKKSKKK